MLSLEGWAGLTVASMDSVVTIPTWIGWLLGMKHPRGLYHRRKSKTSLGRCASTTLLPLNQAEKMLFQGGVLYGIINFEIHLKLIA